MIRHWCQQVRWRKLEGCSLFRQTDEVSSFLMAHQHKRLFSAIQGLYEGYDILTAHQYKKRPFSSDGESGKNFQADC